MAEKIDRQKPRLRVAWNLLAEERIQAAQAEGHFDNLPGFGKPIPGIDEPYDDLWWVKDKLKREQLSSLPPALAIRRDVEQTLARIQMAQTVGEVRQEITNLNERIRQASFAVTWGPSVDVTPFDEEAVVQQWRSQRGGP